MIQILFFIGYILSFVFLIPFFLIFSKTYDILNYLISNNIMPELRILIIISFLLLFLILAFNFIISIRILVNILFKPFVIYYIYKYKKVKEYDTVLILGKDSFWNFKSWYSPSNSLELISITLYLNSINRKFRIFHNAKKEDIKKIMENKDINYLYLNGHGSRHSFVLNPKELLYYCDYKDERYKNSKLEVHQLHCNHLFGTSLGDYVVSEENLKNCNITWKKNIEIELFVFYLWKVIKSKLKKN